MTTFEESNLGKDMKSTIEEEFNFEDQTLIQEKAIPYILEGRDVIGESATGSGKTLAFGVGVVERSIPNMGIQGLIITPTRELAEQVKKYIDKLSNNSLNVTSVYGGVSINRQIKALKNTEIVVATPGRLIDHINRGTIRLDRIKTFVLDEADTMLDMGFIDDIEDILKECPKDKQTLFFSATIPQGIQNLAKKYMNDPVEVTAKKQVDPTKLKQILYQVPKDMKFSLLVHLLKDETSDLVMVFCNTRNTTNLVAKNLRSQGFNAIAIHGGYSQNKRNNAMNKFKAGKKEVLVCTDVAARGIHVEGITHIYNFDIPNDPSFYVHRIGRTARAGNDGKVINLLCDYHEGYLSGIFKEYDHLNIERHKRPDVKKLNFNVGKKKRRKGRRGRRRRRRN